MKEGEEGLVRGATEEGASVDAQNELPLLTDEKFDFDLSLSSSSANEDDEVFFGPVGHRERCVAASLELQGLECPLTWSPLAGEKYVEIFKEARLLALQIESSGKKAAPRARSPEPAQDPEEEFVREARLKLAIFEQGQEAHRSPLALKRETYCVPTPGAAAVPPSLAFAHSPEVPEPAASGAHLLNQGVAERKGPSRLQLPKASSTPAKPQLGKQIGPLRPPLGSSRVSLGTEPSKQSSSTSKFGARKTLLKPPGTPRTLLRGKSASFSGPVCSVNPTLNWSSLGTPAQSEAQPSGASSRWPDTPRPRLSQGSISYPKDARMAQVSTPLAGRTGDSASVSLRQPQTPKTGMQRPGSNPNLSQGSQPVRPKGPRGPSSSSKVGPQPANPARHLAPSVGPSPDTAAPRGQGWSQLPAGPSSRRVSLLSTPAQGGCARTPLSARRMSALPTPSRRRASLLPSWSTPGAGLRTASSPKPAAAAPPAQVLPRKAEGRSEQAQERNRPGAPRLSDPPLVVPLALNFASSPQRVPEVPGEETEEQPAEAVLIHIEAETRAAIPATPRLPLCSQPLIDFSNSPEMPPRGPPLKPAVASEGPLLIDLFHSPEAAKSILPEPLPPVTGQLIDLSSPLISLSPVANKEHRASPLLRL